MSCFKNGFNIKLDKNCSDNGICGGWSYTNGAWVPQTTVCSDMAITSDNIIVPESPTVYLETNDEYLLITEDGNFLIIR